ncbi:hypothetical protein G6F57_007936 [Rhizopus arrhizus]|uniref:DUF7137 domain-containing protein n=1 Tax=Rhizopus oryzae TaxID=64495 RepID=A0A9P6X6L5_RHIOR|nr:hypothetical protein G6F23_011982 [Rhizopus arrhizus]KAG1402409.1 hypothetical protein G6F58_010558 [Rhizopus delemar]KAG0765370.1 hypothetical protein G6F24_004478 [Rhizopus arrhizus]KAG0772450.1 hypothetical protein G6F22_015728 [Rhizopus arrhizus]KAG0789256.1 hypothetical protein G6F21_006636 [Rhizopus arrhizus]
MRLLFQLLIFACLGLLTIQQTVAQSSQIAASSGAVASTSAAVAVSSTAAAAVSSGVVNSNSTTGTTPSNNTNASNSLAGLPTSASYGNTVFPGSATFLTPTASKSVSPLYRIDSSENVTFAWSFTNLLVRPTNLTLAAVAPNSVTYTITAMDGAATSATWALSNVPAASPLMMGMYTIHLYDQRGISATASPGWLSPASALTIAFYSAESYATPTGTDYCPTCFYNSGRRLNMNMGPMAIAFGIASLSSVLILYGLIY